MCVCVFYYGCYLLFKAELCGNRIAYATHILTRMHARQVKHRIAVVVLVEYVEFGARCVQEELHYPSSLVQACVHECAVAERVFHV